MLALSDADVIDWVDLVSSARIPPHLHTLYLYKTGLGHLRELPTREYGPNPSLRSPSNLRHVLFRCCFVPFPPQNLVTLRLLAPFDQDWSPATPMLLDILANASRLESLWLYQWVCDERAISSTSTLEMPSLLEMQLTANGWQKPPRSNSALLAYLVCPYLTTLTCEGDLCRYLSPSESNHGLGRLASALCIRGDRFPGALYTYSLRYLGPRRSVDGPYNIGALIFGYISLDDTIETIAGARYDLQSKNSKIWSQAPIDSLQHPNYDPAALRALSAFAFHDEDLRSIGEAHVFQSIIAVHASEHQGVLSEAEVLHLGTYSPTRDIDWSSILVSFMAVHTLIIDYEQPNPFHEDGLIVAVTRRALEGRLLLPSLTTVLTDQKVPWRARDVSSIRAFVEARAACGGTPLKIRPLDKNEWKPAVLNYFDGLV